MRMRPAGAAAAAVAALMRVSAACKSIALRRGPVSATAPRRRPAVRHAHHVRALRLVFVAFALLNVYVLYQLYGPPSAGTDSSGASHRQAGAGSSAHRAVLKARGSGPPSSSFRLSTFISMLFNKLSSDKGLRESDSTMNSPSPAVPSFRGSVTPGSRVPHNSRAGVDLVFLKSAEPLLLQHEVEQKLRAFTSWGDDGTLTFPPQNRGDIYEEQSPASRKSAYLLYLPHSGYHNQRIALENAMYVAARLNRTLVVPNAMLGAAVAWAPFHRLQYNLLVAAAEYRILKCKGKQMGWTRGLNEAMKERSWLDRSQGIVTEGMGIPVDCSRAQGATRKRMRKEAFPKILDMGAEFQRIFTEWPKLVSFAFPPLSKSSTKTQNRSDVTEPPQIITQTEFERLFGMRSLYDPVSWKSYDKAEAVYYVHDPVMYAYRLFDSRTFIAKGDVSASRDYLKNSRRPHRDDVVKGELGEVTGSNDEDSASSGYGYNAQTPEQLKALLQQLNNDAMHQDVANWREENVRRVDTSFILPTNMTAHSLSDKFRITIDLATLSQVREPFLHFGSLFGSTRLWLLPATDESMEDSAGRIKTDTLAAPLYAQKMKEQAALVTMIQRATRLTHPGVLAAARHITGKLAIPFFGFHIRYQGGSFPKDLPKNIERAISTISTDIGLPIEALAMSGNTVKQRIALVASRTVGNKSSRLNKELSEHMSATRLEVCIKLASMPSQHPTYAPLVYLATDARDPRGMTQFKDFFSVYPCTFLLDDFFPGGLQEIEQVMTSGSQVNTPLAPSEGEAAPTKPPLRTKWLIPFIDLVVVSRAKVFSGTRGSTFSKYVERIRGQR